MDLLSFSWADATETARRKKTPALPPRIQRQEMAQHITRQLSFSTNNAPTILQCILTVTPRRPTAIHQYPTRRPSVNDLMLPNRRISQTSGPLHVQLCAASVACSHLQPSPPLDPLCQSAVSIVWVGPRAAKLPLHVCSLDSSLPLSRMAMLLVNPTTETAVYISSTYGYLVWTRSTCFAQPGLFCARLHRLKTMLLACPCVIH